MKMKSVREILNGDVVNRDELLVLLKATDSDLTALFEKAAEVKEKYVGNVVYYRGLIEYSNMCSKDCYYCGVRNSNSNFSRYSLTDEEVVESALFAYNNKYASIVIQSGERQDSNFVNTISKLIRKIHEATNNELRITLSLGEQSYNTYKQWFDAGVQRYLLRLETSNKELYKRLHPEDGHHTFDNRMQSLMYLRELGYQCGTGVMVGLPFQTLEDLADDLILFRRMGFHMFGLGPYIEHVETPLYQYSSSLLSRNARLDLALKMVAIIRILMKDVNIAATTAMQAIDPLGRERAIKVGANVIMPNLTPVKYREDYKLYEDKPCMDEDADKCKSCLEMRIKSTGNKIGYGSWGDSKRYTDGN